MSLWLRAGPISVSSRGRVGAHVGPVGIYGGGRRRRRSSGSDGGFMVFMIIAMLALAAVFVAVMWPLSLFGHAIGLTPSWHQLMNRDHTWMHHHYALVGLRYLGASAIFIFVLAVLTTPFLRSSRHRAEQRRQRARAEFAEWLAGPPPALELPGRFTAKWIAENVPTLHPGQVPVLVEEMTRRGWSSADIERRVVPYLPDYAT